MSSEGIEHLSSVHDNPFVRQFGLPHHARQDEDAVEASIPSSASSERGDDDGEQEYHVNSGFVNKLRSKFAQLENKRSKVTLSKKSASVENLLSSSEDYVLKSRVRKGSAGRSFVDDTPVSSQVTLRHLTPTGYQPQIRPRSNELEKSSDRPPLAKKDTEKLKQNNVIRSVKPPLPKKFTVDTNRRNLRSSVSEFSKPKPEHHDWKVAPDLEKVGRDNIVIIESKHEQTFKSEHKDRKSDTVEGSEEEKDVKDSHSDSHDTFGRVKPATDKEKISDENELPKPNTVSAFRTLFEKSNKALDTLHVWRSSRSPTRKSSGSDTNSPQVLSPVSTPRSPLAKVTTDNVFENSFKSQEADLGKPASLRENTDTKISSPTVLSSDIKDTSDNVDTTSSPMQKTLEMFRNASEERELSTEKRKSGLNSEAKSKVVASQSTGVQHTLTPVHPVSKVFDSKSVAKADKPRRPKPTVLARKDFIPKDTLELKHEADRKRQSLSEDNEDLADGKKTVPTRNSPDISAEADAGVFYDTNVKPSAKKENDALSPRQTKVFDSSKIVKKNREPPKVPVSPVESPQNVPLPETVPNVIASEVAKEPEKDVHEDMEISPVKPQRGVTQSKDVGLTEIKPNIVRNETKSEKKSRQLNVTEQMFQRTENLAKPDKMAKPADNKGAVSGMSSFLANRLKKTQPDQENQLKTTSSHLTNGSSPSPVPRKRQAPQRPEVNGTVEETEEKPPLPKTPEPVLIPSRSKKVQPKETKGKMVFDSSKIATKRKEPPKRKPPRKTLEELNQNITFDSAFDVPKLDLSSITNDKVETEYQEGYIPTVIKPCPYHFVGAEITFPKSPYQKTRRPKVGESFDEICWF